MNPIFALVDCNSFYCSCERVFQPKLQRRPLIVLSNNDGCAVSLSDEAKMLGIKMGDVYFKIKDLIQKHQVAVQSSNYALYGDMSSRLMNTLSSFVPEMEIYSIDEAFLSFQGMEHFDLVQYSHQIKETVYQYTGIPTCIGIAPTKVLAKVANKIAKKNKQKTQGIFDLRDEDKKNRALQNFPVEDIWGIGRSSAKKLYEHKIKTAFDLMNTDTEYIRKILTVVGSRLVQELRGNSCIDLQTDLENRKQILSSRSFGQRVQDIEHLKESIAHHISIASEKLRSQNLVCQSLTVFIQTNHFKVNSAQYFNSASIHLPTATSYTPKLIKHAFSILEKIYRPGFDYKKAGILLNDLSLKTHIQTDFFSTHDTPREEQYMSVIDGFNRLHGKHTLKFAACGISPVWKMMSKMKSPCFTTRWNDIPTISGS
jgi:DNA polymerase V